MGFSKEWEQTYKSNAHLSVWPWSEVISLTHRFCDLNKDLIVLELGCGAGANIPYFICLKSNYYALEGSQSVVAKLNEKFKDENVHIKCADFTKDFCFDEIIGKVDLILDRSSVTHNATKDIQNVLKMSQKWLKAGGKYMAFDWFSLDSNVLINDEKISIDDNTFIFKSGYYAGLGNVHFSDENHIKELFGDFKLEYLVKNTKTQIIPEPKSSSSFSFVATKI